jgi:hypothetical protein
MMQRINSQAVRVGLKIPKKRMQEPASPPRRILLQVALGLLQMEGEPSSLPLLVEIPGPTPLARGPPVVLRGLLPSLLLAWLRHPRVLGALPASAAQAVPV